MKRREAITYLTKCADDTGQHWHAGYPVAADECPTCKGTNDAGHLRVPCSRYGSTGADCAPVAYRAAVIYSEETGFPVNEYMLAHLMSLTVNDHDDIERLIRSRPHPERYL